MGAAVNLSSVMATVSGERKGAAHFQKESLVPGQWLSLVQCSSALPPWSEGSKPAESVHPSSSTRLGLPPLQRRLWAPRQLPPGPQREISTPNLSAADIHVSYRKILVPYSAERIPCPPK